MPAYVLIRETRKERRAPLRVAAATVAGLGLAGALLGGVAYGPGLAAGLLRFFPLPVWISESGHGADATNASDHVIRIKAGPDGHYYVEGDADGVPVKFMIDTGSTRIVLPKQIAERMSVGPLNFDIPTYTANGVSHDAEITIRKLTVGPYSGNNIPAMVNGGPLDMPLLGMSWLRTFQSIEIENGVMTLHYRGT
ncbi:MAG: TIGR02281 family clan AA aspartic protease [Alphaproteobacteria bacterium]|nr:TIGR02281 family clan AA aspartic protease [Alphaproteobacteria bacterium]MBV9693847.1 TIGR02281 family clan AA aspartic protease [Alphaproteobacteria bacterium]